MTKHNQVTNTDNKINSLTKHLLIFTLGKEEYAIDISAVQGIRNYNVTTKVSNCPDYVKGVTKLDHDFALLIDLRIMLNVSSATYNDFTLMIILKINDHLFGIVIDDVLDVLTLADSEILPSSELTAMVNGHYIQGMINHQDRLLILLNIEKLFSQELLHLAKKVAT